MVFLQRNSIQRMPRKAYLYSAMACAVKPHLTTRHFNFFFFKEGDGVGGEGAGMSSLNALSPAPLNTEEEWSELDRCNEESDWRVWESRIPPCATNPHAYQLTLISPSSFSSFVFYDTGR